MNKDNSTVISVMMEDRSAGFAGHICSGLVFFLMGNWFTYNTSLLWWKAEAARQPFRTQSSYQQGWKWPWESMAKIFCSMAYALGELLTGCCDGGSFLNNAQHITMCGLFLLNGLTDLLIFYRINIPHHFQHLSASLAFLGESFLFENHSHGMSPMFQQTHTFLYMPSYFAAGVILVEALLPSIWLLPAMRNLAIILHGSWLIQSAFMLYGDQVGLLVWEEDASMLLLPMILAWHLLGGLLLQAVYLMVTKRSAGTHGETAAYSRLSLGIISDSEDDTETIIKTTSAKVLQA